MLIGVPKEIKNHEYRVGLTPASVRELVAHGHQVIVQRDAGTAMAAGGRRFPGGAMKCELCPVQPSPRETGRERTSFKFIGWPQGGVGRQRPKRPPVTEWPYWVGRC